MRAPDKARVLREAAATARKVEALHEAASRAARDQNLERCYHLLGKALGARDVALVLDRAAEELE